MDFDPQHGLVELGTRGHYASAQGVDVDAEVAALDRIHAHPARNLDFAARRLSVAKVWSAIASRGGAGLTRNAQTYAGFDVGQGSTTVMTTYAVEGDTLRIVHTARLPLPVQTVNVTMTIGGE